MVLDSYGGAYLVKNDMTKALPSFADLPLDVQAYIAAKDADILGLTLTHAAMQKRLKSELETTQVARLAERTPQCVVIQSRDTIIIDLRLQLDGHKKYCFGSRSESLDQLALALVLEEHEIAQASEANEDAAPASEAVEPPRTTRAQAVPQRP